jgi:hypothetical protein
LRGEREGERDREETEGDKGETEDKKPIDGQVCLVRLQMDNFCLFNKRMNDELLLAR